MSRGIRELEQHLDVVLDGAVDEAARRQFAALLAENDAALDAYVAHMRIHALLHWRHGHAADNAATVPVGRMPVARRRRLRLQHIVALALVTSIVLLLTTSLFLAQPAGRDDSTAAVPGVGYVIAGETLKTSESGHRITAGDRVDAGVVRLEVGQAQIKFDQGAVVDIVAPADFSIVDSTRLQLRSGKLTVDIAQAKTNFTVDTPMARVVDQGTRFGVDAEASGATGVVVFDGSVELHNRSAAESPGHDAASLIKTLTAGDAVRIGADQKLDRIMSIADREPLWTTTGPSDPAAMITAVSDNLSSGGFTKCYRIVPRGLVEDAPAYVDRDYQWNGIDAEGLPAPLRGADLVMTFNDDKRAIDLEMVVSVSRPGRLYVFVDERYPSPDWLPQRGFLQTGWKVGMDESSLAKPGKRLDRGPGRSIDRSFSVWECVVATPGLVHLGGSLAKSMYAVAAVPDTYRVACVGDSITAGSGYVSELGKLLGETYEVANFGVASTTLLSAGERPYTKEQKYQEVLRFHPHFVVIMLGTNDTKPENYRHFEQFVDDYKRLVASFQSLEAPPKIFACTPVPVYYDGNWGIDNGRLKEGVLPGVRKAAEELKLPLIDMNKALSGRPDLFYRDNVHPIGGGQLMAAEVYQAITGREAPITKQPPPPPPTLIACLGDSITEGSGYPAALQERLGNKYVVRNFGVSGATLLDRGDKPYRRQSKYQALKDFQPNVVIVMLGTNDTKPQNYEHIDQFAENVRALVDDLAGLPTKPTVFLCKPVPVMGEGNWESNEDRLRNGVIPAIETVAGEKKLPLIDMHGALEDHRELYKDNVHSVGAQRLMAEKAFARLIAEKPPAPPRENFLKNPGFESGSTGWTTRGGKLRIVDAPVRAGRAAGKVSTRTANWHGPAQSVKTALLEHGKGYYDVRAALRCAAGAKPPDQPTRVSLVIMLTDHSGVHYLKSPAREVDSAQWTEFNDHIYVTWDETLQEAIFCAETLGSPHDDLLIDETALDFAPKGFGQR